MTDTDTDSLRPADDDAFHSISGRLETAEPANPASNTAASASTAAATAPATAAATAATAAAAAAAANNASTPSMRQHTLAGQRPLNPSISSSSPLSSREASPARPYQRSVAAAGSGVRPGFRSRKSSTDASPSRTSSLANSTTPGPSPTGPVQRAHSATSIPDTTPATQSSTPDAARAPRSIKAAPSKSASADAAPHWPISPRLKSPPPSEDRLSHSRRNSLRSQIKRPETQSTPAIIVQSSSPASPPRLAVPEHPIASEPDEPTQTIKAPPARGSSGQPTKLETVQESSLPATSGFHGLEPQSFVSSLITHKSDTDRNDVNSSKVTEDLSSKHDSFKHDHSKHTESGSDSASKSAKKGKMQEQRSTFAQRPQHSVSAKPSLSSMSTRARDPPLRNMTVETETVPSVAQASIVNQDRSASGRADGGIRLKPSNETIRPKKEKKPPKRKAASINAGTGRLQHISYPHHTHTRPDPGVFSNTPSSLGSPMSYRSYDDRRSLLALSPPHAEMRMSSSSSRPLHLIYFYSSTNASYRTASSKADVFEQKVASAVDEADSSDSDATFIYESNPPDPPHRSRGHHSRTPSMTSLASLTNPQLQFRDNQKHPSKKSSTKFKFTNPHVYPTIDGDDRGEGTVRSGSGRAGGGSHHHHIGGRYNQGRGGLNHLVMDSDSSMPQSSRNRGPTSRNTSQPNSPRFHTFSVGNGHSNGSKKNGEYSAAYDIDAENAADDERTPLISGRSPRARTPRQRNSANIRHLERRHHRDGGWCRRFAGCLVLSILLLVVVFCAVGLVFATTKPLTSLVVRDIQNVVASQEEVILDLIVDAVNPNIIGVTVADMEVSVFAKSKHVGSDTWWREHGNGPPGDGQPDDLEEWQPVQDQSHHVDTIARTAGVDEGTDPIEGEPRTMLLGRVNRFDSPLTFEGSFFQRHRAESIGELRLGHPGNKTEAGGSERWEEVLQHPFELIVRGNFKYTLPLSTQEFKVPVTASHYYDPDVEKKKKPAALKGLGKRRILPPVLTKPWGRYDRRALLLWNPQ
ncbi:vacuolar segregation subunit 7-domain-containing protein [Bipolaris maydis]|nr:vacuolar segregation subunit 7-domain-containing protein [Bipolaris maydis]